jgi:DNA-directed RNA polymerase subunit RPC12/RpoP
VHAASAFRLCGEWSQGIARIRCPKCGFDRFRPFSCKSYLLCPSCAQKRTLLLGEYLSEDLLLRLPHRQFVWTIPKVLRVFLRHDRGLFADIGRLLFDILSRFFSQAAGRTLRCAMVSSHQTFGEFGVWHPHWHSIVLEGGFDRHDRFFFIPLGASKALSEIWRRRVVALFLQKGLLNPDFARKLLGWEHSGFSIESGTRIWDQDSREALCQYIVRAPLSLQRIRWDEQQDAVTWSSSPSGYFKGRQRRYSSLDFIAQVTLHIPPRGKHLMRRYGLYSSRGRGTWKERPAIRSHAPASWYGRKAADDPVLPDAPKDQEVGVISRRKAWARLLAKIHELDVMACPRCGSRMAVLAVIVDPAQIRKIIACLQRHDRGPPPLD